MYVKNRMTADPYTVSSTTSLIDVIALMHEKKLKRVPVVGADGKRVVGIITDTDIQKASPSEASTLSIFEINYLLRKLTAGDAMTKDVFKIGPDALLEDAALIMRANRISTLVVVEEDDMIVGIITESDIFDAFLDLMGFRDTGTRITIQALNAPGVLTEITGIFRDFNYNISHIAVYGGNSEKCDVVIRFNAFNTEKIVSTLEEKGFKVLHLLVYPK